MKQNRSPLLTIDDLAVSFLNGGPEDPRVQAVDGARLDLFPGQTVAIVGESGCGKSVTAMSVLGLVPSPPSRVDRGEIRLRLSSGEMVDLLGLSSGQMRSVRGGEVAMIFQEPMTSLNPVTTIGDQLVEAIRLHRRTEGGGKLRRADAERIAIGALDEVGIPDPGSRLRAYPHEFSGGMRQRVMIAMALACEPRVLLADEPTTALDVTIQKQILDLLDEIKQKREMGVILITHDLGVVAQHSDVVCVMYAGRVVEYAPVQELYESPLHPYTRGLLECIPRLDDSQQPGQTLAVVSEFVARNEEFEGLAVRAGRPDLMRSELIPWWPWAETPSGVEHGSKPPTDYALAEVKPMHWVGLWRTPDAAKLAKRVPSISPADMEGPSTPNAGELLI